MSHAEDFLDELIAEGTERDQPFPALVYEALRRRELLGRVSRPAYHLKRWL